MNVGVDTDLLSDIVESVDQEVIDYRLLLTQASSACSGSVVLLAPPNGGNSDPTESLCLLDVHRSSILGRLLAGSPGGYGPELFAHRR